MFAFGPEDIEEFVPYLVIAFLFVFVVGWFFLLGLISTMSGWARLAGKFETKDKFGGQLHRFQSARMKKVGISGVLNIGASEKGLYLCHILIFRPAHKPLLIPWGEITAEPCEVSLSKGYRLSFRSFPDITLEVSGAVFDRMIEYLEDRAGSR